MSNKQKRPFTWSFGDPEHKKLLGQLFDALNSDHPLQCVVLCAAYVERSLYCLLEHYFISGSGVTEKLLSHGGAVGDIRDKARLSHCLGLIDKQLLHDIETVGIVRNHFAHSQLGIDFDNPAVSELCFQLKGPDPSNDLIVNLDSDGPFTFAAGLENNPGRRFIYIATLIALSLGNIIEKTRHRKRALSGWSPKKPL
jgi:hypothetical protein